MGLDDNIFDLGGDSLLLFRIEADIQKIFPVEIQIENVLAEPTVRALVAEVMSDQTAERAVTGPVELIADPDARFEPFPLTDIQQAYWIGRAADVDLGNVSTHNYYEVECEQLDTVRLERAWQTLIDRHDMLRMTVRLDGTQQAHESTTPYTIEVNDLSAADPDTVNAEIEAVRNRMSHQVLPSETGPLFEVRVTRTSRTTSRLHVSVDALIMDGWSRTLLFQEWHALYEDEKVSLPELTVSFRDCVLGEKQREETPQYEKDMNYWRGRLDSLPGGPELPTARSPEGLISPRFIGRRRRIEPAAWAKLQEFARSRQLTPSGVLLACYVETLRSWSASPHFTVNLTLFNRPPVHEQVRHIVGDFTSLLMLECEPVEEQVFVERARRLQEQLFRDLDHRSVSGVQILRELTRHRGGDSRVLMPVVFTSMLPPGGEQSDTTMAWAGDLVFGISQTPQLWIDSKVFQDAGGGLILNWDAVEELFPTGLLDDMFNAYADLVTALINDPASWDEDRGATRTRILPRRQSEQFATTNATGGPIPNGLLHQPIFTRADSRPDAPAVIDTRRTVSYKELTHAAQIIAQELRAGGARPNQLVAIVMEKGWEQIAAAIGINESGAAFLPIDAHVPTDRLHYLLEDGQVRIALTQSEFAASLDWPEGVTVIPVDEDLFSRDAPERVPPPQTPDDLAYVIYTSGSTGKPKGVMSDHRGPLNTVIDVNESYSVGPDDRVLALSALTFDLSIYDIFGVLSAGGALVLPDPAATRDPSRWAQLVSEHRVTLWNTVPALMELFTEYIEQKAEYQPLPLRVVMMSGDWIPVNLPDRIHAITAECRVISMGGATEASIWSIVYPIDNVDPAWASIPYGKPMKNQTFHVYDETFQPCPEWVSGDLHIGGIGLAKGYWRNEQKTSESFYPHPQTGDPLYRTGDLGRYLPGGNIEFMGRFDFQVKIQGFRIELGEIEAVLNDHPGVRTSVVSAIGKRHGAKRLVGYIIGENGSTPDTAALRDYLLTKLPEYMVPAIFVSVDRFPLTANGKVDRSALPEPGATPEPAAPAQAESSELTREISELVRDLLELPAVKADEDLLELGLSSVDTIRLATSLDRNYGFRPKMRDLFRFRTVAQIAQHCAPHVDLQSRSPAPAEEAVWEEGLI